MTLKSLFKSDDLPILFVIVNYFYLLPILLWPFCLLFSGFLFDNPKDPTMILVNMALILGYPLLLIMNLLLSFHLYRKVKILGFIFSLLPFIFFYFIINK
jgi:hypothetical protein